MARRAPWLAALAPSHPSLCRVRRLFWNKLGPEGGMALAEALKRNATLEYLWSAALPLNPHPPMHSVMLPCIPPPSSVLSCLSRTSAPFVSPARAQPTHTACTHREPAAAAHVPARRVDRGHALLCRTGGWRDVRAPSRLPLPVAGCRTTASASGPSGPSGRPPAAASSWSSSELRLSGPAWCSMIGGRFCGGLELHGLG